jgi:hypothetical protein
VRVMNLNKGSKKGLRQIRWKQHEAVSAALLFLLLTALAIWLAFFEAAHEHSIDPFQTPELRQVEDP